MALEESERQTFARNSALERSHPRHLAPSDSVAFAGAARGLTFPQALCLGASFGLLILGTAFAPHALLGLIQWAGWSLLAIVSVIRMVSALTPRRRVAAGALNDRDLPRYTLLLPLYREAEVLPDLIKALGEIDYPVRKLQAMLLLEADDAETLAAAQALALPGFCEIHIIPPGFPRTKPRACNIALEKARGDLLVIYDAEDRPHPLQLREAAARFAAGPKRLACLQAPLRIERANSFLGRQFAMEYAVQFEVLLPALARLGAPFPLGGTSNHFNGVMYQLGQAS